MRVVTLVPYRPDGGRRDELWRFVRARWEAEHPDWPISVGLHDDGGPFCRSVALNRAARQAGDWDAAVILDADAIINRDQIRRAVLMAYTNDAFVIGYANYRYLTQRMSDAIMRGYIGDWYRGVRFTMVDTCSTCVAVSRSLWDRVGGFDEGFVGWGFEDCAFATSCAALGKRLRVPGDVWHLWHEPSPENDKASPDWQASLARLQRYAACGERAEPIAALLAELRD